MIIGKICNSSFLPIAHQPSLITASISFGLPAAIALLILFAATALISALYFFTLRSRDPRGRAILVLLRALYTAGILLVILDAAIVYTRQDRSRLFIIKSNLPMLKLGDTTTARSRDDVANDVSRSLASDRNLAERFSIHRINGTPGGAVSPEAGGINSPIAAIVSLTDTSNAAMDEAEGLAARFAAPLFIVAVGAANGAPDLSLNSVDSEGSARLGLPFVIRATMYGRGLSGRSTLVKLSDEALVSSSTVVNWREDSETKIISLLLHPKVQGLHRYTVSADATEGEINTENNRISFSVDVQSRDRKVLFIENQPTWEGKFIRRALEENRSIVVDYFAQVSRSAVLGQHQTEGAGSAHSILGDFKQLASYDAIILGPVDSSSISEREAKNVTAFVERRGGGLIILGSNDFSGSILSGSSPLMHLSPARVALKRLPEGGQLPIQADPGNGSQSQTQGRTPSAQSVVADKTFLVPAEEGKEFFPVAEDGESIVKLGPFAKPQLEVKSLNLGARALAIDGSQNQKDGSVLIAAEPYGYGRTLLFTPSDSWKIALAETGVHKGAFALLWQNLVLWTAEGAEPASSIRLHTSVVEAGDIIRAYLTARDDSFNSVSKLSVTSELEYSGEGDKAVKTPLTIKLDPNSPGIFELNAAAPGEGDATLSVRLSHGGGSNVSLSLPFSIQKNRSAWRESAETIERLRITAQASSGALYEPDEIELLRSKLMGLDSVMQTSAKTERLRHSAVFALLLILLMSLEYFLRKRYTAD